MSYLKESFTFKKVLEKTHAYSLALEHVRVFKTSFNVSPVTFVLKVVILICGFAINIFT